jgi:hypothetical protein
LGRFLMAAGGYKEFVAGEVLDEDEINDFLMQGVLVFAGTAARGSAIGTPVEGQFSFLKDSDTVEFYDGSAWVELSVAGAAATGGDEVETVGGYKYHIFTTNGTLAATASGDVDVLLVGGGGGGGVTRGGGGGAGEIQAGLVFRLPIVASTNYAVTVGAGGAGTNSGVDAPGASGGNTTLIGGSVSLTARGGGGGGTGNTQVDGVRGGSGGGGGGGVGFGGTGAFERGNTSNDGGNGQAGGDQRAGGGGGATAVGATGTTSGDGGEGATLTNIDSSLTSGNFTSFTGMTVIASGGGGGAASNPGDGGTGAGDGATGATLGGDAVSFGSGGGGAQNANAGDGKAGIVIVRYSA